MLALVLLVACPAVASAAGATHGSDDTQLRADTGPATRPVSGTPRPGVLIDPRPVLGRDYAIDRKLAGREPGWLLVPAVRRRRRGLHPGAEHSVSSHAAHDPDRAGYRGDGGGGIVGWITRGITSAINSFFGVW